jgi:hypothetical protein
MRVGGMPPVKTSPALAGNILGLGARGIGGEFVSTPLKLGTDLDGAEAPTPCALPGVAGREEEAGLGPIGRTNGGVFATTGRCGGSCRSAGGSGRPGRGGEMAVWPFADSDGPCDLRRIASATARSNGEECGGKGATNERGGEFTTPAPCVVGRAYPGGFARGGEIGPAAVEFGSVGPTAGRPGGESGDAPPRIGPRSLPPGGRLNELTAVFPRSCRTQAKTSAHNLCPKSGLGPCHADRYRFLA